MISARARDCVGWERFRVLFSHSKAMYMGVGILHGTFDNGHKQNRVFLVAQGKKVKDKMKIFADNFV